MVVYVLTSIDILKNMRIYDVFIDKNLAEKRREKEEKNYKLLGNGLELKFKIEMFELQEK